MVTLPFESKRILFRSGIISVENLPGNFVLMLDGRILPTLWYKHEEAIDKWNEEHPEAELDYLVTDSVCVSKEPSGGPINVYTNQPYITRKQVRVLLQYIEQAPQGTKAELSLGRRTIPFRSMLDLEDWLSQYQAA